MCPCAMWPCVNYRTCCGFFALWCEDAQRAPPLLALCHRGVRKCSDGDPSTISSECVQGITERVDRRKRISPFPT